MVIPDVASVLIRTAAFVALFQATGAVGFLLLFGRQLTVAAPAISRLAAWSALLGAVLLGLHQALNAVRMADAFSALWDGELQHLAWNSTSALAHEWQVAGLMLVAVSCWRRVDWLWLAAAGAATALAGFVLTGHTSVHPLRPWLAALLLLHLVIVAFWFGSLWPLVATIRCEPSSVTQFIWRRFSTLAGWLVPLIAAAGIAMALLLMPDLRSLRQPYGQLLLFKLAAFVLLMVLAALNRWRWLPALGMADASTRVSLRRSVIGEIAIIVAILAATAVLTTFYSPD